MKTLLEVTNKILAKAKLNTYTNDQKKQLYKILFTHLFLKDEDKICETNMEKAVEKLTELILPHHFESVPSSWLVFFLNKHMPTLITGRRNGTPTNAERPLQTAKEVRPHWRPLKITNICQRRPYTL